MNKETTTLPNGVTITKTTYEGGNWRVTWLDAQGRKIRSEDSDGYWEVRTRDSRGHVTRVDYCDGDWYTRIVDEHGCMSRMTVGTSEGLCTVYDRDHRLLHQYRSTPTHQL